MYKTRTATKAIIIKNGKVLLTENIHDGSIFYVTPGGGLNHNESLEEGMRRECLEETGIDVEVKDVLFVRDFIADRHETRARDGFHQVEIYFRCEPISEVDLSRAHEMDYYQTGVKWVSAEELMDINYHPAPLKQSIIDVLNQTPTRIYVGDIA